MDPFSIAGVSLEALGLGAKTIKWIKKVVSKKIIITPSEITTTSKHWDSSTSIIIQNTSERPLFAVQVVCWFDVGQDVEFKPRLKRKLKSTGGISIDTMFYVMRGTVEDEKKIYILEIGRILPRSSLEVDLQIKGRGTVRFLAVRYDENSATTVLSNKDKVGFSFTPPFTMKLEQITLAMKRDE